MDANKLFVALGRRFDFESWKFYLVVCFVIYLSGFFLAPSHDFQMRWFYYTVTVITVFMLLFKGKVILSGKDARPLKYFALITLLLFLPYLWTPDSNYVRTVRLGLERWLFVYSFALAVFYCLKRPELVEKWIPLVLITCAFVALCMVFYNAISLQKLHNVSGMLCLGWNPNQTGMPLGVAAVFCLSCWFAGRLSWKRSLFWCLLTGLFAFGVWLTTARSAMLGLVIAGGVVLSMKLNRKWVLIIPLLVIGLVIFYVIQHKPNPENYMLTGRVAIWQHIWEVFKANPVFGGGGRSTYAVITLANGHKLEAHSMYFGVAYYAGSFGLLVLFGMLAVTIIRGLGASRRMQWMYFPLLAYGLTVHVFEGIYPLFTPHPFWLFTWLPILMLLLRSDYSPLLLKGRRNAI